MKRKTKNKLRILLLIVLNCILWAGISLDYNSLENQNLNILLILGAIASGVGSGAFILYFTMDLGPEKKTRPTGDYCDMPLDYAQDCEYLRPDGWCQFYVDCGKQECPNKWECEQAMGGPNVDENWVPPY